MRKLSLLSGKAKTRKLSDLDDDRYEFLSIENAEPNLGAPNSDNAIAGSNLDGSRKWLYPTGGLVVNDQNEITVDEDNISIDTTGFINTTSTNLHDVLTDFDDDIASIWTLTNQNYIAEGSNKIIADTSANSFTITLPLTPLAGYWVKVSDPGNWGTNPLTIDANGNTIEGLIDDYILNESDQTVEFVYNGATWEALNNTGPRGYTGSQGEIGYTGSQGEIGFTGSVGYTGSQGEIGYTGSKGDTGFTGSVGYTGSQGEIGYTGSKGDTGFTGSVGFTGSQGEIGYTGSKGDIGFTGSQGVIGFTGSQGVSVVDTTISGNGTVETPYSVEKWNNTIKLTLDGAVSGFVNFDGSADVTLTTSPTGMYEFSKTLTLTDAWIDVGINATNLETGTYVIQVFMNDSSIGNSYNEYISGIMSWYSGSTNPVAGFTSDEIALHRAGERSQANIFLRTFRSSSGEGIKLQVFSTSQNTGSSNYIFKFKKLM